MGYKTSTLSQITIFLILFLICGHVIAADYNYKSNFVLKQAEYVATSAIGSEGLFANGPMPVSAVVYCGNKSKVSCSSPPWMDVETGIRLNQETRFNITYQAFAYLNFTQKMSGGTVIVRGRCGDDAHLRSDNKAWLISCTWYGTMDTNIILSPVDNTTIDNQTIKLEITSGGAYSTVMPGFTINGSIDGKTPLSSAPGYQTNQISFVFFRYQTYTQTINSCCNLAILDEGYLSAYRSGVSGNVDFSYTPESLSASFTSTGNITTLEKTYEGEQNNFNIGEIWLLVDGRSCNNDSGSLCSYIIENSITAITCDSDKATINLAEERRSNRYSQIRTIRGTWGRENIDTTCAITVTIPYE